MQTALRIGDVMKRSRWLQEEKKKNREKEIGQFDKARSFFFKVCEYRKKKGRKKHRIREKQEFMDCVEKRPLTPA